MVPLRSNRARAGVKKKFVTGARAAGTRPKDHSVGFARNPTRLDASLAAMSAKARSAIQPRAHRSASAGYEGLRDSAGRGGVLDKTAQFVHLEELMASCSSRTRRRQETRSWST